jgi:hypothetical protein
LKVQVPKNREKTEKDKELGKNKKNNANVSANPS